MNTSNYNWPGVLSIALAVLVLISCDKTEPESGPSANLIFHETFEGPEPFSTTHNKETGEWEYALQYVDTLVYDGTRSARFEIQHDQPLVADGKRSEVTIIMGINGQLTKNAWYSFAVYFPSVYFAPDTTYDVISQWHNDGSPARLIAKGDLFMIDIGNEIGSKEKIEVGELTRDTWHEFIFHFIHSPHSDGYLKVWQNGEQKVARSGGNTYNEFLPKWKIGIYKGAFEVGTSLVTKRVVFFDNIKVGNENATYRDMEPMRP